MNTTMGGAKFRVVGALLLFLCLPSLGKENNASPSVQADRIVIMKAARTLTLMKNGKTLKTYKVSLGTVPIGPKQQQGDHKTPEGVYFVDEKVPNSRFHIALHLSYPSAADRERARKLGVSPGGNIEIHGLGKEFAWVGSMQRMVDWTDGCIAVTDDEIEEIYAQVSVGTPVEIRP